MRIVVPVPGIRRFDRADVVAGGGRAKGLGSDGAGAVVGGGGVNWCGAMLVAIAEHFRLQLQCSWARASWSGDLRC